MKLSFKKFAALGVLVLGSMSANSAVITDLSERDWLTSGDGLLTFDASTGLEWLDLTHTEGWSLNAVESASFFGEFRWALTHEVEDLLDAAVLGNGSRKSLIPQDVFNTNRLMDLVGSNSSTTERSILGITRDFYRWSTSGGVDYYDTTKIAVTRVDYDYTASVVDPWASCCSRGDGDSNMGAWLVRNSVPEQVSEPATLSLLALALAGLGFARRQKKS